jgi:hypothetical protein
MSNHEVVGGEPGGLQLTGAVAASGKLHFRCGSRPPTVRVSEAQPEPVSPSPWSHITQAVGSAIPPRCSPSRALAAAATEGPGR